MPEDGGASVPGGPQIPIVPLPEGQVAIKIPNPKSFVQFKAHPWQKASLSFDT
jgi:hypothetical protein